MASGQRGDRRSLAVGPADSSQPRPYRIDDSTLGGGIYIRMYGQAEDLARQAFRNREPAVGNRKIAIRRLPMQRLGIVDRGRNPLGSQGGGQAIAGIAADADRVLGPDGRETF